MTVTVIYTDADGKGHALNIDLGTVANPSTFTSDKLAAALAGNDTLSQMFEIKTTQTNGKIDIKNLVGARLRMSLRSRAASPRSPALSFPVRRLTARPSLTLRPARLLGKYYPGCRLYG